MKLGKFELDILSDGLFKLDGGVMFGIVPKVLWSRSTPPDDKNRILLGLNSLLIRTPEENILIETGIGDKFDEKNTKIFGIDHSKHDLLKSLKEIGLDPEDINRVILTHLHFDHSGWNTRYDENEKIVPTFKNAKYIVNKSEWETALNPDPRSKASYKKENFLPLEEAGLIEFVEEDQEIIPGIKVIVTGGHTKNHQIVKISSEGKVACFLGDIIPTNFHLKNTYVMSFDIYPIDVVKFKEKLIKQILEENWYTVFCHAPSLKSGYINEKDGKLVVKKES